METHVLEVRFDYNGKAETIYPVVIRSNTATILVDCGYAGFMPLIANAAKQQNLSVEEFTSIIITHHDIDHMGGLAEFKQRYSNLKVYSSPIEEPYISGKQKSLRLIQAEKLFESLPEEQKQEGLAFQQMLQTMKTVAVDYTFDEASSPFKGLKAVNTPGHMPGHMSIYVEDSKTLIAADALVLENGELEIANPAFTLDLSAAVDSIRKLSTLDIDTIICYHGGVVQGNITAKLQRLLLKYATIASTEKPIIEKATPENFDEITEVWEASVRATHHFLAEKDVQFFKGLVRYHYLKAVKLFLVRNKQNEIAGFLGTSGDKVEMLFIHPKTRGKGIGKTLLQYAINQLGIKKVDVNEQNEQAVKFYERSGFKVVNRSSLDVLSKPYPILHMELM